MKPLAHTCLLIVLLLAANQAHALRCGLQIVTEGDHQFEVLEKCGRPTTIDQRTTFKRVSVFDDHLGVFKEKEIEIVVQEWFYEGGPNRFNRLLRFENGRLREIETLGYGQ